MPDLDQTNELVSRYLIQHTIWWIEYAGLSGIREDTYPFCDPDFGVDWTRALLREYPKLGIVGECWGPTIYTSLFQKNSPLRAGETPGTRSAIGAKLAWQSELPSVMDFGLFEAFDRFLKGEGVYQIYRRLAEDFLFDDPHTLVTFLGNHDTPRPDFRNTGLPERVDLALFILLTTRGIPQLLYGDELGMVGGQHHEELRADFPGGFPGDDRDAFTEKGRTEAENARLDHVRATLQLRKTTPALQSGRLMQLPPRRGLYAYARYHPEGDVICLVNEWEDEIVVPWAEIAPLLDGVSNARRLRDLLSGETLVVPQSPDVEVEAAIAIPALTGRVFIVE
jgi:glycosidase